MPQRKFTEEVEKEICRVYSEERLSKRKVAEKFKCAYSIIPEILKRHGFKLRSLSEAGRGRFEAENNNWKGGKYHRGGYVLILKSNHPNANNIGYVLEHRLVMEKHLGRLLNLKEVVHHINGNQSDNRIENLMLFGGLKDHFDWHKLQKKRTRELLLCFGKQKGEENV